MSQICYSIVVNLADVAEVADISRTDLLYVVVVLCTSTNKIQEENLNASDCDKSGSFAQKLLHQHPHISGWCTAVPSQLEYVKKQVLQCSKAEVCRRVCLTEMGVDRKPTLTLTFTCDIPKNQSRGMPI